MHGGRPTCTPTGLRLAFFEACEDGGLPAVEALAADQGSARPPTARHPSSTGARHARADDG